MALKYGATIIYTSGKTNINLTVLYDYICHILFNFELVHKPNFIEKEAYFIPAGYDDLNLLKSNEEIKKYLEEPYEQRIKPEINNFESKNTEDLKTQISKIQKDKKFEDKKIAIKEELAKKTGIKIHGTGDKIEKNTDNKPEGDNDKNSITDREEKIKEKNNEEINEKLNNYYYLYKGMDYYT